jgi:hypothetical protein
MSRATKVLLPIAVVVALVPATVLAQEGQIAGTVRDTSGAVIPGVLVEATSPALIEKVRAATTDDNGQYRITNLPVGTYSVTFTLAGFTRQQRDSVILTTGFTAPINATMSVGQLAETISVTAESPVVDIQNARQVAAFEGEQIRELPTTRNIRSILTLTPGLTATGLGADCVGGVGVWCNNNIYNLSAHTATNDTEGGLQGRVMVGGTIINTGGGAGIMGMTGGYVADVANAQEVNVQISGALGESETGGASINIIPRTGGNSFSGNYFGTYTQGDYNTNGDLRDGGLFSGSWFSQNNGDHPEISNGYPLIRDYDTSVAFGGPIKRDRLWFFSAARAWQKDAWARQQDRIWDNANAGIWGQKLPAGSVDARAAADQLDAQRQHAPHGSGVAEEQVQLLLGRGIHLPGSVRRLSGAVDGARRLVVGPGASGPAGPGGVDESADQRHPARSGNVGEPAALRLLAASLLHAQSRHSTRRRIRDNRWCDSRLSHPQRHELHDQRCAIGTMVRPDRRRRGATTAQRLAAARVVVVRHRRPCRQVRV